jgi:iron(III) transport system substrate-binding protein
MAIQDYFNAVFKEREAGLYLRDIQLNTADYLTYEAKARGMFEPVKPALILPEVLDDSKWLGGLDSLFYDKEGKYLLSYIANPSDLAHVNRDFVPESELRNVQQLLDPRFRGRIVIPDVGRGEGVSQLAVMMAAYGEDFLTDLLTKQQVIVSSEARQRVEWVVRGRYPIGISVYGGHLRSFQEQGLGLNIRSLDGALSYGAPVGAIQLMNQAPHPNAAKVYLNWLLTQRTQQKVVELTTYTSARLDVPPGVEGAVDPARLHEYFAHGREEFHPVNQRARELVVKLLP